MNHFYAIIAVVGDPNVVFEVREFQLVDELHEPRNARSNRTYMTFKVLLVGRDEVSVIIRPSRVETCDAVKVRFTGNIEDKVFLTLLLVLKSG